MSAPHIEPHWSLALADVAVMVNGGGPPEIGGDE